MGRSCSVSIVIRNYNYGRFVRDAIDSAIRQDYAATEITVVDDGSTDNSREIIESYGHRVRTVFKKHEGHPSGFNAGFAAADGEIVCFLDSDDIFAPDKVRKVVRVFEDHPEAQWCFHPVNWVDRQLAPLDRSEPMHVSANRDYRTMVTKRGRVPYVRTATSGMSFRRSLLDSLLPMPADRRFVQLADNYLKFVALALSRGFFLGEKLASQRIHDQNQYTSRGGPEQELLKAHKLLATACAIRIAHPKLSKLSRRMFVKAVVRYRRCAEPGPVEGKLIASYLGRVSAPERIRIRFAMVRRSLLGRLA